MRLIAWAALAATFALAGEAAAATAPAFDVDTATRAWIDTMTPDEQSRSNSYFEGGYLIGYAGTAISILIAALFLFLGWARGVRAWLERTVKAFPLVALGMSFFYLVGSTALSFPFTYYVGFVRQHEYGLSNQTLPEWLTQTLIITAISLVVGAIFITILYMIVRVARNTWWLWGTAVGVVFAAALGMLFPVYIAPLINDYTEMEAGPQRDEIIAMARANGVPADNVYVFDRSAQTNAITANVSGMFGTTRISLADTLLDRGSPEAVRAVMGHEIGHYVLGHVYSGLAFGGMLMLFTFAVVHFGFRALAKNERWGIRDIADPAGLPLIFAIAAAISIVTDPIQLNITRFQENQADAFGLNAARAPDGFAQAAVLLSEYRKMEPAPFEEFWFYTHPSGYNRIHRAMTWKAHEIAAGRLPNTLGGPGDWRPNFRRNTDGQETPAQQQAPAPATPAPAQSPAAPSD